MMNLFSGTPSAHSRRLCNIIGVLSLFLAATSIAQRDTVDFRYAPARSTLDADRREDLAVNTGGLKDGVWSFFAAFHGMAHTAGGNAQRAQEQLYAFANHASTLGTWVEE